MPIRTNYCHKCGADVGSSYSTMNGQPICENCKIQVIESQQTSQQPKSVDTPIRSKVIVSKFVHQSKENKRKSNDDGNPLQFESVQVRERIEIPRWNDRLDRIERVYKMHQEGLMTKDDFVAAKRQALYGNY